MDMSKNYFGHLPAISLRPLRLNEIARPALLPFGRTSSASWRMTTNKKVYKSIHFSDQIKLIINKLNKKKAQKCYPNLKY
jgi:hypothetical protein